HFKGKNIAIVHDKSTYGQGLAAEVKKTINKSGVKEKLNDSYTNGDSDFTALASKVKGDKIDIIFVGGYHREAGQIVPAMGDNGLKTILIAGDSLADKEFASITGPQGEGTLFTFGPDPRKKATAAAIVKKFQEKGVDPEGYTLYTYAAFQIWAQAVAKAGTTDAKKIAETIKAGTWNTVMGPIAYDKNGDIKQIGWAVYKFDKSRNWDELPGQSGS